MKRVDVTGAKRVVTGLVTACVALALWSCDSREHATSSSQQMEASQPKAARLRPREIDGEAFYEFDHGDATFRFRVAETNPTFAGSSAFTVFLGWPGPQVVHGYGRPDLRHFIHLVVGGNPSPYPAFGEDHLASKLRVGAFAGPVRNETLGLLEYRRGSPTWSLYLSEDPGYLGQDGFRPFAACRPTPSSIGTTLGSARCTSSCRRRSITATPSATLYCLTGRPSMQGFGISCAPELLQRTRDYSSPANPPPSTRYNVTTLSLAVSRAETSDFSALYNVR